MAAKEHTFVSKYTQHEILRRPKMEVPLASGGWIPSQQRVSYPFKPSLDRESGRLVGQLTVREGQDVLDTDHSGTLAPDKEIGIKRDAVQFLLDHRAYGEDFWLLGHDPGTLYPRPVDWREDVNRASIFGKFRKKPVVVDAVEWTGKNGGMSGRFSNTAARRGARRASGS
jgi:hypothetical protein